MDSFEISYDLDRKTYASVIRRRLFGSPRFYFSMALFLFAGLLGYLAGPTYYALPALMAMLAFTLCFLYWKAPTRFVSSAPYLSERKTIRFTPERIFLATASVKSEFPWTHFIAWHESPDYFMLDITSRGFCSALPKAAFSEEQQAQFRKWAAAELPKFPKRLKRR